NFTLDYRGCYFEEFLQHIFLQRINAKSSQQITVQDFTYFKDIASQWLTIKLSDRSVRTKAESIKENIDSTDIT
ncbi:24274_t:CDS:1, partial [Cetraspora pellucida]